MKSKRWVSLLALLMTASVFAQEEEPKAEPTPKELQGQIDSITEAMTEQKNVLDALNRLRITGYVQAQYVDNEALMPQYTVRRGRINFSYQFAPTSRVVIQPDISSAGVALRDAYVELTEPWTAWRHTLTAGQFKVPFGFEIRQSSRDREMPERTRVITTLFPGERDRGAMLTGVGLSEKFSYRFGVLNGNGIATGTDNDEDKDVAGRLGYSFGAVDVGASGYTGSNLGLDKERYGFDVQWVTPLPGFGVRGEYIAGKQPGTNVSRDVSGWYVYAIQNVGARHQFVLRYDTYDPNTDARRDGTDNLGGSYIFHWDANLKAMFAYENVQNEVNDPRDNVLTIRLQYAF